MARNHQIQRLINDTACPKQLASHIGIDVSHLRRMARPDMSIEQPDASGTRNDWDRIEEQLHFVAAKPGGPSAVMAARVWMDAVCMSALGQLDDCELTNEELAVEVGEITVDYGQLLLEARPGFDALVLLHRTTETMAAMERFASSLRATVQADLMRRAAA